MQDVKSLIDFFYSQLANIYGKDEVTVFMSLVLKKYKGYSKTDLLLNKNEVVDNILSNEIHSIIQQLKKHEPLQYILGETEFYGLNFKVDKNVLIPRPETEELVDLIIKDNTSKRINVLDIGTGSGCIAITLKKNIPSSVVTAIDISDDALTIAKQNAINNKADINFIQQDILSDKLSFRAFSYNLVVSNPPYITQSEKTTLQPNVLNYEPHLALFVNDNDPLLFYRIIAEFSQKNLVEKGKLYFEINEKYGFEIVKLLKEMSFKNILLKKDLSGKNRFVIGEK